VKRQEIWVDTPAVIREESTSESRARGLAPATCTDNSDTSSKESDMLRSLRSTALIAATAASVFGSSAAAWADLTTATAKLVTNTKGGKNQNPVVDRAGKTIVFTSNVDQAGGTIGAPTETFDHDDATNDFGGTTPPQPICVDCDGVNDATGNLFVWRLKRKGTIPENSVQQITFSNVGGFTANQFPDLNQRATYVAWDSDQDHVGSNADGNREIFLYDLRTATTSQLTSTIGNGDTANRSANLDDKGNVVVFDSRADFSAVTSCKQTDGATACSNADGNSEIMVLDRSGGTLTQLTDTTGNGANANLRGRVSNDGRYVAFQSTRNFAAELGVIATCVLLDGVTACGNADENGEIMLFDRQENALIQVTSTANAGSCSGTNPNERVEISKRGKYLTWQSKCEADLNPTGCGDCDGNDEVFLAELKPKRIVQATISEGGFNRVPRISGSGRYIVFESNRSYLGANGGHGRTLYVLKRVPFKDVSAQGITAKVQLEEDSTLNGAGIVQNTSTDATTINFTGGFNTTIEQFGVSTNGRFVAFDNSKGVGNQETWLVDRKN
jgi:Tol biopolymer transport system component